MCLKNGGSANLKGSIVTLMLSSWTGLSSFQSTVKEFFLRGKDFDDTRVFCTGCTSSDLHVSEAAHRRPNYYFGLCILPMSAT